MRINNIKYVLGVSVICISAILFPDHSKALDHDYEVSVEFSFDANSVPGKEVSGYRLYKEGINLCEESAVQPQIMSCTVKAPGTFDFTLSVLFSDGSESPQSSPFTFSVTSTDAAIVALQVLSGQNPQDIEDLGNIAGTSTVDMADVIHSLRQSSL